MKTKRWLDPRLLIGMLLVVASVAAVVFVVSASNRTHEVWSVSNSVVPGDVLTADDVALARVQLDSSQDLYHDREESPIGGVVTRPLEAGELIPVSAVADAALAERSRVVVTVDGPLPDGATRGAVVDVWAAEQLDGSTYATPRVLVDDAVIAAVHTNDGLISTAQTVQVELLVPSGDTGGLLHAMSSGHAMHLVPDTPQDRR